VKIRSTFVFAVLAVLVAAPLRGQSPEITADELRAHVRTLASDAFEGRGSGTAGERKAAAYIVEQLRRYGVRPGGDSGSYYQAFEFVSSVALGTTNALSLSGPGGLRRQGTVEGDFRPLGFSANGNASGPLVFAGYGISSSEKKYDDYADLDVKGKIVVVLRYGPDGDSPRSEFSRHTSPRNKERLAREKGAAALIVITGPANDDADDLMRLRVDQTGGFAGIPVFSARRSFFAEALATAGKDLKSLQDSIKADLKPRSFVFPGHEAHLTADLVKVKARATNVVGILDGTDPVLKNQVVVLGAHFDHLGFGGPNSMMPDTVAIHNGADDNASGTAGLLELTQKLAAEKLNRRTYLVAFFSGEELGTLGSQHLVAHPPLPGMVAMLNMDMIGRLQNRSLDIGGTGTSPVWAGLIARENADSSFTLKLNPDGFGPSDHASFYGKDIPVLFFFTGTHDDYHKPSDDWDKLNYEGEERVVRFVSRIVRDLDATNDKPAYARVESPGSSRSGGDSRGFSVTMGIIPDFGESTSNGLKISGIRPNGPAEKAGLKAGDILTKLGGKGILGIYDYMGILGELKAGQEVEVEYLRDGAPMKTKATMAKRN
jgi:aminopeptidase YwaD